jgi:nitrous oxide reductase accessory protein NosL
MTKTHSNGRLLLVSVAGLLLLSGAIFLAAQTVSPPQPPAGPSEDHKCPVCGMFVKNYPGVLAAVVFKDGATAFFDGSKDMFRYLFEVPKYAPGRTRSDVATIWATDYYSQKWIDASTALFVRGSDVLGPMGRELIPFGKENQAKEFMKDHKGDALLRFADVTPEIVKNLD